ncbi:MAG: glycosyltransferase family 39 protein [Pseudomonadota bacterium]
MSQENAADPGARAVVDPTNAEKTPPASGRSPAGPPFLACFALLAAALSLFLPLASSGIWDPPERETAELGRRIALNLLGGHDLAVLGANNDVPTRGELGRGELPFTSVAAGFRVFGLHEWAGRLPLALWGALGLLATYLLVRRLSDRRSAWFAVLVLSTMPLYFLHARTMLGDIVTMASLALAISGWGLAVFERRVREPLTSRVLFLGLGSLGAACAVLSRGVLIGVAVPAFSIGVTWLVLRAARVMPRERLGDGLGALALMGGTLAGLLACRALYLAPPGTGPFTLLLGTAINRPRVLPTFDSVVLQLGHALFPWSAVLPVAFGALLRTPPGLPGPAREREAALRVLVLTTAVVAWFGYGIAEPVIGPMPFGGVAALAVAVALFARDFERGAPVSRAVPMVVCALAILLLVDFKNFPDKGLSAFCVADAHFPDSFKATAGHLLEAGTLIFCGAFFFLLQERSSHQDERFNASEYRAWWRVVRELWAGNLQFALLVLEAALIGLWLLGTLGDHVQSLNRLEALGAAQRRVVFGAACALPLLIAAPWFLTAIRDAFRTLFDPELGSLFGSTRVSRWLAGGVSRAQAALYAGAGFGLCLSLVYYPRLAAQISPKQVYEAYQRDAKPGEELGMLGPGSASASYYAGRTVPSFELATRAFDWLTAATGRRRWLVIRDTDLAPLNSLFRATATRAHNLPVLDARSSEILLVSNQLGGETNQNPLARYVLDQAPHPSHALAANLDDKLDVLGWDTLARDGQPVAAVEAGRHYEFVIYYRVVQPITGSWETFIHVDGFQRRFNGDHPTLDGKYPFNLWHVGDFIADRYDFALEPNFGAGSYRLYFGLYSGTRRLEVRRGAAEENRLDAGLLVVR